MAKVDALPHSNITPAFPFRGRRRISNGRSRYFALAVTLVVIVYWFLNYSPFRDVNPNEAAGNSTLGFQKVLVLSRGPSWRTRGLEAAAKFTGLDIQTPKQPHVTNEMIDALQKMGPESVKHPKKGEASNWLAHLDMVKFVVASEFETTLILEDDVDWGVTLKDQMRLVSTAVREFTYTDVRDTTPYGGSWDILWIGHCGEHTGEGTRKMEFSDPSVPPWRNYTGWAKHYIDAITPGKRAVQRGENPVCTFGYALSRRGAEKVLRWAGKGENEAFDIRLMQGCKEKHLSCLTINPEIMHHYVPPTEFGHISDVAAVNGGGSEAEDEEFEKVMGNTANIVRSTRCKVLFDSTCMRR